MQKMFVACMGEGSRGCHYPCPSYRNSDLMPSNCLRTLFLF